MPPPQHRRYRNARRRTRTFRQRCLARLEKFINSRVYFAFRCRKIASLPFSRSFRTAIEMYDYISTTRYLVPLTRHRVLNEHYRKVVLSGEDKGYFRGAFRMTVTQFNFVVDAISDHTAFARQGRKPQKAVAIQLKVALHRLCHDGSLSSYSAIGRTLGVSTGSVVRYTRRCVNALAGKITRYVVWPSAQEKIIVKEELGRGRFRDVIGVVDGTMIPFHRAPSDNPNAFATRKSNFSMGVTGICDHRAVFTHIYTGYVGTKHDSAAYKDTDLYKSRELYFSGDEYIIGDSAYSLTPTVITAYKGRNQLPNRLFNKRLRATRVRIEHAFGYLKALCVSLSRMRLDHAGDHDLRRINQHIFACVVLYNMLRTEDIADDSESESDSDSSSDSDSGSDQEDLPPRPLSPAVRPENLNYDSDDFSGGDDHNDIDAPHGNALNDDIRDDNRRYRDEPWRPFNTAAEQARYERHQRILGQRKRERLKNTM